MEDGYINNIFIITNGLEKFVTPLYKQFGRYNLCESNLDNFAEAVKKRQRKAKITSKDYYATENNLIIIDKQFYTRNLKHVNENIFLANFNSNPPHFLFVNLNPETYFDVTNLDFDNDDFYYNVSEEEQDSGQLLLNEFFLSLIFKCMANRNRVHNYIVTSFQTIVESTIIAKQKLQIEKLYKKLEAISKMDSLTNVLSRKAFFESMQQEIARTTRDTRRLKDCNNPKSKKPLEQISEHYGHFSCLMIDFDNFKQINDSYGHIIGDDVLKKMGDLLNSSAIFRETDIIGRYGGEEFIVILPETNAEHAASPAERLRESIEAIEFSSNNGSFHVTISIGIAEFEEGDTSCDDVIRKADIALYRAKEIDKNKVVIYEEIDDEHNFYKNTGQVKK